MRTKKSYCCCCIVTKRAPDVANKVPFPTVTICGSGFHMNNVERKVAEDFSNWRKETGRTDLSRIVEDMADYMEQRFLIKRADGEDTNDKNHNHNQPSAYRLTIFRYAIIVSFSKYR